MVGWIDCSIPHSIFEIEMTSHLSCQFIVYTFTFLYCHNHIMIILNFDDYTIISWTCSSYTIHIALSVIIRAPIKEKKKKRKRKKIRYISRYGKCGPGGCCQILAYFTLSYQFGLFLWWLLFKHLACSSYATHLPISVIIRAQV